MDTKSHILIIDQSDQNSHIIDFMEGQDYQLTVADNSTDAWALLTSKPDKYDVILLDQDFSDVDGIHLIKRMQAHGELDCTVVLLTDTTENLEVGAQYYVTKPAEPETLLPIVAAAIRHQISYKRRVKNKIALSLLKQAEFRYRTVHQAHALASYLSDICSEPKKAITGLTELMLNAVEHGNLAISYNEKSELTRQGRLSKEIQRRLALPEYKDRYVVVSFQLSETMVEITIEDQGNGFDWEKYMEFDTERLLDPHGRGIAIANKLSLYQIEYIGGVGNKVVARFQL